MPGWEAAARNKRLGPKTEIATFEKEDGGKYWIKPQKLSIEAATELRQLRADIASKVSPSGQRALREAQQRWQDEHDSEDEPSFVELQGMLSDEEWQSLSGTLELLVNQSDIVRLYLRKGIGEHNFDGDDGRILELDDSLVDAWMQHEELASEMVAIIERWNRPLAEGSEPDLSTALSGASTEPSSSREETRSQTEQTRGE